eukprot:2146185-Pleurochrysis_carterae.AAC.2
MGSGSNANVIAHLLQGLAQPLRPDPILALTDSRVSKGRVSTTSMEEVVVVGPLASLSGPGLLVASIAAARQHCSQLAFSDRTCASPLPRRSKRALAAPAPALQRSG